MNDAAASAAEPFSSVHTPGFPALLRELRCSLLVTTFRAGRVILMRPRDGSINTHFVALPRPMGLAADRERLFVGAHRSVHEYRNMPAAAARADPPVPVPALAPWLVALMSALLGALGLRSRRRR